MRQIILTPFEDGIGWTATIPSLPGCITEGDTKEEAISYALEAMELYLETLTAKGWEIPPEDEGGVIESTTNHAKASNRRNPSGMYQNTGTRRVRSRATGEGKPRHFRSRRHKNPSDL